MGEERVRRATRRLAEFGLLQASFPGGSRLIDLGCGSGDTLLLLGRTNKACTDLIGVDFSKEALSNAVSRLAETPTMLCRADAKYLPFETRSFTHLTAFGVLEHVTDVAAALAEMMRVVQPGGIIYITTSNCLSLLQIINAGRRITHRYPYGFQRNWTPDEIREVLSPWAAIEMLRIVHADWDMPFVRTVDAALRSAGWGRYIYIRCVRRQ
jgi:ubiquinone/menaquinone biosynthesis C-methylase UbiE